MEPHSIPLSAGVTVLPLVDDHHFRTDRLTAVFSVPLTEETAAEYAILPDLLTRCCRSFPSVTALNRHLDDLYGALVSAGALRLGGWQTLYFSIRFLNRRTTIRQEDLTADCTKLLLEMLFDPVLDGGCFREEDVAQEKRCLIEHLQSEKNNKRRYARQQCEKLLCPGQPGSINPRGTVETAQALTTETVTAAWRRLLQTARVNWIYQGDSLPDGLLSQIEERFSALPERQPAQVETDTSFTMKESEKTEEMDVKQAKLVLGLRIAAAEPDGPIAAARVMNALFGGDPSSLLFTHVREEQSLCYYCSSSYDRFQGTILVDSGVQAQDVDKAKEEILRQLDAIRQGQFTDDELEACRKGLIRHFRSLNETTGSREGFYLSQAVFDRYTSIEETVQQIEAVTRDEVCTVARLVHFDTTYLLKPMEGGAAE